MMGDFNAKVGDDNTGYPPKTSDTLQQWEDTK